jgi:hypothetical protein
MMQSVQGMQRAWYIYLFAFKRKQMNYGTSPPARPQFFFGDAP